MTLYRKSNPEFYEEEKKKNNERNKAKYANNPEKKEAVKKRALDRYYRLKAEKTEENTIEEFLKSFS